MWPFTWPRLKFPSQSPGVDSSFLHCLLIKVNKHFWSSLFISFFDFSVIPTVLTRCLCGQMVSTPDFESLGLGLEMIVLQPKWHKAFTMTLPWSWCYWNELPHDKTKKMTVPSEDSDQPGHPPSLLRVFAVRMKKAWVLSYPLSAQWRFWSDSGDA